MLRPSFPKLTIAVLALVLLTSACENRPEVRTGRRMEQVEESDVEPYMGKPADFDYGKVENNVYTNSFFNCTMNIPKGWVITANETADKLQKDALDKLGSQNSDLKKAIDAGEVNSANLLGFSKFDLKTPNESNPNVMIVAENVTTSPAIKTGREYLLAGRELMQKSGIIYNFPGDIKEIFINGKKFHTMDVEMITPANNRVHQRYYATMSNGFAIGIIASYLYEKEGALLEKYIYSLKFEK